MARMSPPLCLVFTLSFAFVRENCLITALNYHGRKNKYYFVHLVLSCSYSG